MKTQVLLLIAMFCSSAFATAMDTPGETADVGTTDAVTFTIGLDGTSCGVQRGGGDGTIDPNPKLYATQDCAAEHMTLAGSYLWALFQTTAANVDLITGNLRTGLTTADIPTFRASLPSGTLVAIRFDASSSLTKFGEITQALIIGTRQSAAGAWGAPTGVTAAEGYRHYLIYTIDTTAGNFLTDEAGVPTTVAGTGSFLTINTRTGEWTAYASGTDVKAAIEALPEEEDEEENSASILSIAALVTLGAIAIFRSMKH